MVVRRQHSTLGGRPTHAYRHYQGPPPASANLALLAQGSLHQDKPWQRRTKLAPALLAAPKHSPSFGRDPLAGEWRLVKRAPWETPLRRGAAPSHLETVGIQQSIRCPPSSVRIAALAPHLMETFEAGICRMSLEKIARQLAHARSLYGTRPVPLSIQRGQRSAS